MITFASLGWILLQNFVNAITYVKRWPYLTAENQPDYTKTYAGKTHLFASRIFKPTGTSTSKSLLVIRIHGGGFIMNNPAADDVLARYLADKARCVVASMDYSKAPLRAFPAAYEDLIELVLAAIGDVELDIDPEKVVLCGSSSGGNLALAIAQDPRIRPKLMGVLAFTPIVDFVTPYEQKLATRPNPQVPDFLSGYYHSMVRAYLGGRDVSLESVMLSPARFRTRQDLPEHLYLVGVEHDLLSKEVEVMAERLAEGLEKTNTEKGWQVGSVKWDHIKDQSHGFENFPTKDEKFEEARLLAASAAFQAMADWLIALSDHAIRLECIKL